MSRGILRGVLVWLLLVAGQGFGEKAPEPDLILQVPMRDGVELEADVFLPHPEARNLPCVLIRSPRGRHLDRERFAPIAHWGYAVVIQDTRLRTKSGTPIMPYFTDGWGELQDGYDTVEWIAKHPVCDGKVATVGESALGITQLLLAPTAPPSLKCQYISIAAPSLYHHAICPGGQVLKDQVEGWMGSYADPKLLGILGTQPLYNDFWARFDAVGVADRVKVPGIHFGGWYDTFCQGTIEAFVSRQNLGGEGARGKQKLVIGPWTHRWPQNPKLGDFEMPHPAKEVPMDVSMKTWLDSHLKEGEGNELPAVLYYVMGPLDGSSSVGNEWRKADSWPVPATQTAFYLNREGKLTDASLDLTDLDSLGFTYDPNDPVPTVGGRNLFLEAGPKDQRPIEARPDVLVWTSAPFEEDLEVTGRMTARVYFTTDQKDTDVVVRLCDVYPDGRSILISDGLTRLGVVAKEEQIRNGKPIAVDVDLWSTSMVLAKGHRLRVSLSSSNYPRFEKNRNLGLFAPPEALPVVAHNKVYYGERYSSRIILPIVRAGGQTVSGLSQGKSRQLTALNN